jgi:hypothetical protein
MSRASHLKNAYGLTQDEYDAQLSYQNGGCAICGRKPEPEEKNFPVDHNHKSGSRRGILCSNCNLAVGFFRDSPSRCRKAAAYLEEYDGLEILEGVPTELLGASPDGGAPQEGAT